MTLFQSAFDKIAQAQIHVEALWNVVKAFEQAHAYELVGKNNPDRWHSVHLHIRVPPPIELPLIAGDAMHNARSALDHAIYALSTAPAKKRNRIAFPLYPNRLYYLEAKKTGLWERTLAGVDTKYRTIIEREQPFRRRNRRLGALAEFDNIDKHRIAHVSFARSAMIPTATIRPAFLLPYLELRYWPLGKRMKEGTEVFAHRVTPPRALRGRPIGRVDVKVDYKVTIGFGPRNLTVQAIQEVVNRTALVIFDLMETRTGRPIPVTTRHIEGVGTALVLPGPMRPHLPHPLVSKVLGLLPPP